MQSGTHGADRIIITGKHQSPVLAEIVALGRLQRRSFRSEISDLRSDLGEVSLWFGARFEQPLSNNIGIPLGLTSGLLIDSVRIFQRFLLQLGGANRRREEEESACTMKGPH